LVATTDILLFGLFFLDTDRTRLTLFDLSGVVEVVQVIDHLLSGVVKVVTSTRPS
jgi:hypothetical protein